MLEPREPEQLQRGRTSGDYDMIEYHLLGTIQQLDTYHYIYG